MFFKPKIIVASAALSALMMPQLSSAQTILEEVVVTAQKREQSMQDVGISVTAITGDMMADMGITEIAKLQDSTPNLRINKDFGSSTTPQFSIRGVGSLTDSSAVSSSPVAIHVNEVPYAFPVTTGGVLFDLVGVEVLRGPQGDLFGLNTTGGTVNFTTAKPTEEFEGSVTVGLGNYGTANLDGYISGAVSDTVGMRLAIHSENRDGHQTNRRLGTKHGDIERFGARLTTSFTPSDTFSADLEIHTSTDKSDALGVRVSEPYIVLDSVGAVQTVTPKPGIFDTDWTDNPTFFAAGTRPLLDNKGFGASLRMNLDLANGMSLASVTGVEDFERVEFNDYDGGQFADSDNLFLNDIKSFTQEVRLSSGGDDDVSWVLGANFGSDDIDNTNVFDQPGNIDFPAAGGQKFKQDREMRSIFGHAEFQLNDELRLIGGLRYTEEERDVQNIGTFLFSDPLGIFGGFWREGTLDSPGGILTGCIIGELPCPTDANGLPSKNVGINLSKKYDGVNAKLGLNWQPSDSDALYYASISHGFKTGGFGDIPASSFSQFTASDKETLTAYEIGSKQTLLDGAMRLNGAVFFYDYEDQQVGGNISDVQFGPLGTTVNAPESEMYGLELELVWAATEGLEISQGLGFTKGTYKKYQAVNGQLSRDLQDPVTFLYPATDDPRIQVDLSGDDIGFPEVQYNGSLRYTTDVGDGLTMRYTIDYSYESKEINKLATYNLPSYWLVNARIALFNDENWEATLWAENLLDEEYLNFHGQFNQAIVQSWGMPRTYGVRFKYDF